MNEIEEQLKAEIEEQYGEVLTTSEATDKYSFKSFLAPIVFVTRKSDGVDGTLESTASLLLDSTSKSAIL